MAIKQLYPPPSPPLLSQTEWVSEWESERMSEWASALLLPPQPQHTCFTPANRRWARDSLNQGPVLAARSSANTAHRSLLRHSTGRRSVARNATLLHQPPLKTPSARKPHTQTNTSCECLCNRWDDGTHSASTTDAKKDLWWTCLIQNLSLLCKDHLYLLEVY